jgi:heme-degrading monooxygenase HmoA
VPFDTDGEYVVLASLIPPRSRTSTWQLFRGSRAVTAQLASTPGVVGFALLARPLRKQYATLSVWQDEAALRTFASSAPHRDLMAALGPAMAPTTFVRWMMRGSDGRPSWREAMSRLETT